MKHTPVTIVSLAMKFMCAMLLLGVAGAVSPAFAAGEITINGGLPVTNYRQVSLALTPPAGSVTMAFQNESGAWSAAEPVAATKQWTLSANLNAPPDIYDVKTVSVEFKDAAGVIIGQYPASIKLDYIIDTGFAGPNGSTNWGSQGLPGTSGNAVAVQPADQKVVVAGTFDNGSGTTQLEVIRYNPDGTYDPAFGAGTGKVYFGNATGAYSGRALAIQPDGRIVVVGTYDMGGGTTGLWLMRLTASGALDPTFNSILNGGVGGYLVLGGLGKNSGSAVTLQPDGKIVVVGTYDNGGTNNTTPWVLRFNPDGTPDTSFNSTGDVLFSGAAGAHRGNAVALQPDGRIVVIGTYSRGVADSSVWALRLTSTGGLDTTFGGSGTGYVTYGAGGAHAGNAVAINPATGKIAIVGTWDWPGAAKSDIWLLQLSNDGTLDPTFNPNATGVPPGTVALGGNGADIGSAVAIQADGKIVIAGTYDNDFLGKLLLVQRINADSSYDTSFNRGNPAYSFGIPGGTFAGNGLALQSDNKLVLTGKGFRFETDVDGNIIGSTSTMLTLRLFDHTWPLTVTTVGSGTVAALPGEINWVGPTGSGDYLPGTVVQLTATPAGGAAFTGWTGDCSGTGTCSVTMDSARNVTATFSLPVTLGLSVSGTGTITATSDQGIISCTGSCSADLPLNTVVSLAATPAWYATFSGWNGGGCTGTGACSVTMDQPQSVTALFDPNLYVRLNGADLYSTLFEAYVVGDNAGPAATVEARDTTFLENLLLNKLVTVTLNGGRDAVFSLVPVGYTTVSGSLRIANGRLNASNLKIKP